jgi:large subunit ribosomal protein L15
MKLHDLRPAEGSRTARTRVGRGIAAGKGKTAGRGTKGQKARAGGSIPPWFEGGQTPLHMRIPKLRGFKNRFKIDYEVVNVGAIEAAIERGRLGGDTHDHAAAKTRSKAAAQITVNQDLLRDAGLVRSLNKPLKVLGGGDLSSPLFVVADAFTASARTKIEAVGGAVSVLEVPTRPTKAIGVAPSSDSGAAAVETATPADDAEAEPAATPKARKPKARKAAPDADAPAAAAEVDAPEATADADAPEAMADADAPEATADADVAETVADAEVPADPTAAVEPVNDDEAEATSGDDA